MSDRPDGAYPYDVAYQSWLKARQENDYKLADEIRDNFEKHHGLTIFAGGEMPIEGVTVRRMLARDWHMKYGDKKVAKAIADNDSATAASHPDFKGTPIL